MSEDAAFMKAESVEALCAEGLEAIAEAGDEAALEAVRVGLLGRKGRLTRLMSTLGALDATRRASVAPALNKARDRLNGAIQSRKAVLAGLSLERRLAGEWVDITLPLRPESRAGTLHPVSRVTEEVIAIFGRLGFGVREGPDIESDYYNFDALNMPSDHPAREAHDTFFLASGEGTARHVLRTHTSPVQIRTLEREGPPVRFIAPGRVYRCDYDQTHTPMFHQVEGMAVDRALSMAHLKWVLEAFCRAFFEVEDVALRFRASHFPFTEPSAEVDVRCTWRGGRLLVGEGDDWLEILGCGMVHPNVLEACNVDPDAWRGFAFGLGIDRLAMLKYGMPDLRAFFESDLRWLSHYGFSPLVSSP